MSVDDAAWAAAVDALRAADDVALACHLGPDGDALGSLMALTLALRSLGKRTVASWGSEPFAVPAMYAFLPGLDLLSEPAEFPVEPPLMVTFDTGSLERLGSLAGHARHAGTLLVVDHHESNTRYGDLNLVDPTAAATAVLVAELVDRLGVPLSADIAACLYTGLSTDTGSFRFAAATPDVHHLAARLLGTGIRHDEIARAIWDTNRFAYLKLLGTLLERAELVAGDRDVPGDSGVVWTWVSRDDLAAADVLIEEIEGAIDVIRTSAEADVAVICKQAPDGRWLVSMRSKGAVDVGRIAVALGGGGHRYAAGYTSPDEPAAVVAQVRAELTATRTAGS
ncbi:MAG TPA: bifunctional oligoribonuclease/PAP phosphatase NrnA [Mycobacteriales bacterium]|nr:bifunctional oligoribonuclease/PAP phosphatase NrnA [Mycobacteriales bacterium]